SLWDMRLEVLHRSVEATAAARRLDLRRPYDDPLRSAYWSAVEALDNAVTAVSTDEPPFRPVQNVTYEAQRKRASEDLSVFTSTPQRYFGMRFEESEATMIARQVAEESLAREYEQPAENGT